MVRHIQSIDRLSFSTRGGRLRKVDLRKKEGYTLLEMAMVLGILALIARIILPNLVGTMNVWDLDIEANTMMAKIRQVQQLAIAQQATYRITWSPMNNDYTVWKYDGTVFVLQETNEFQNNVSVTGTSFMANPGSVDFDQFGAPSESGQIILHHNIKMNNEYVFIEPVTGQLRVL